MQSAHIFMYYIKDICYMTVLSGLRTALSYSTCIDILKSLSEAADSAGEDLNALCKRTL